jgi:5-methyltetrahydropteroyltriglutamate--homocysteine methyltransferase
MSASIRTTVVGSYPVPDWLAESPSSSDLRDATMVVLKAQELIGLDVISDGELSRFDGNHPETNGMIDWFIGPLEGVSTELSASELSRFGSLSDFQFRSKPAGVVRSVLGPGSLDLSAAYASVRDLARAPLKFTVTSPYMLARTLLDEHYGDLESLVMALAELLGGQLEGIDAAVVQVDEANVPGRPEDSLLAAAGINRVLSGVTGERAVHLCFGNYGGRTIQQGVYRDLLPFFNALECDHVVLEFARRGDSELEVFTDVKPEIQLGIGVIDIKDSEVESESTVAGRIERAIEVLGVERVRWVHPDCGFWMLTREVADAKMVALVAGRDLVLGIES